MNTNNSVLANKSNYENGNKYYYDGVCGSMTNNECATLLLIDTWGNDRTSYIGMGMSFKRINEISIAILK